MKVIDPWFDGTVYYRPDKNVFYIQSDPLGSSKLTYYGPYQGDPRKLLLAAPKNKPAPKKPETGETNGPSAPAEESAEGKTTNSKIKAKVTWGKAVDGIQIRARIHHSKTKKTPSLTIDLRNVGNEPRWVNFSMANLGVSHWSFWSPGDTSGVPDSTNWFQGGDWGKGRLIKPGETLTESTVALDEKWIRYERPLSQVGGTPRVLPLRWDDGQYLIQVVIPVFSLDDAGKLLAPRQPGATPALVTSNPVQYYTLKLNSNK